MTMGATTLSRIVCTQGRMRASGPDESGMMTPDITKGFTDVKGSVEVSLDPPRPRRSPTTGLVATLFQLAERPELPGVVLVDLLGAFGLSPAAARQHLARMREDGQLAGRRAGRGTLYRLAGPFGRRLARLGAEFGSPPPQWAGHFHALLFTVP